MSQPQPALTPPPSELSLYIKTLIFSLVLFGVCYGYTSWLGIPGVTNKSAADVSIILMGLSMILSSLCYFWNFFDPLIRYRKHLGLIGWAFSLAHVALSWSALEGLLKSTSLESGLTSPAFTGLIATLIFTVMAAISNSFSARLLGGKTWKFILRTGYIAVLLILAHVVVLKSGRWFTWFNGGMQTPPSLSLLVSIFMVIVIGMRIALWASLKRKQNTVLPPTQPTPPVAT